jgi:hypothetical protein
MTNNLRTSPEDTGSKQAATRFKPGQSGNPAGRPKGSRNKIGERFLDDLLEAWEARGSEALAACAAKEPAQFCKIVANILPKEVLLTALNVNAKFDISDLEDAQGFFEAYRYARDRIGAEPPVIDLNPEAEAAWRADADD